MTRTITVKIDYAKTLLVITNPIFANISVIRELRNHGIPVDGGIEIRGVTSGRLAMWNEYVDGRRFLVYEWTEIKGETDNLYDPDL